VVIMEMVSLTARRVVLVVFSVVGAVRPTSAMLRWAVVIAFMAAPAVDRWRLAARLLAARHCGVATAVLADRLGRRLPVRLPAGAAEPGVTDKPLQLVPRVSASLTPSKGGPHGTGATMG